MQNAVHTAIEEDLWTVVLDSPVPRETIPDTGIPDPSAQRGAGTTRSGRGSGHLTRDDVLQAIHRLVPEDRLLNLCQRQRRPARRGRKPGSPFIHTTHTGSPADVLIAVAHVSVHGSASAVLFLPAGLPWKTAEELVDELNLLVRLAHRFDQVMLLATPTPLPAADAFPLQLETSRPTAGAYVPGRASRLVDPGELANPGGESSGGPTPEVVWSTGCFAAPTGELWRLGHRCMPDLTARCQELRLMLRARGEGRLPADVEPRVLQRVARLDRGGCFLRELATSCPGAIRVLPTLGWRAKER